jgi:hypothetical protein
MSLEARLSRHLRYPVNWSIGLLRFSIQYRHSHAAGERLWGSTYAAGGLIHAITRSQSAQEIQRAQDRAAEAFAALKENQAPEVFSEEAEAQDLAEA